MDEITSRLPQYSRGLNHVSYFQFFFIQASGGCLFLLPRSPTGLQPGIQITGISHYCALVINTVGPANWHPKIPLPALHCPDSLAEVIGYVFPACQNFWIVR